MPESPLEKVIRIIGNNQQIASSAGRQASRIFPGGGEGYRLTKGEP
jgi:hypothetical protein